MVEWTAEQARTAILRRQGLLERFAEPHEALRAATVVQTQYAVSLTPALFARARGVDQKSVDRMLREERSMVKTWAHRHTVHTLAREDLALVVGAIGPPAYGRFLHWWRRSGREEAMPYEEVAPQILAALEDGPLDRVRLHAAVPAFAELDGHWGWGADVMGLAYRGELVFAEQGAARTTFARRDRWIGDLPPCPPEPIAELLRRYLRGHAPASLRDFRVWTGLRARDVGRAAEALAEEFEEMRVQGRPHQCLIPRGERPEVDAGRPRLLAKFDPLMMGWSDRSLFVPPRFVDRVVRPAGQIEAAVLVEGLVVGTWRLRRRGARAEVAVEWFRPPGARRRRAVEREAEALGSGMGYPGCCVSTAEG